MVEEIVRGKAPRGLVTGEGRVPSAEGLDAVFRPRSVAVVGASRRPGSIGRQIVVNLLDGDFRGPVFPVNPREEVIHSIKAYRSVEEIPDPVDLAVVVVPRDAVLDVVEACGRKGVRGLVVISAGFREMGPEGLRRERRLAEIVTRYGMRMVGPNCMGVINTDPEVRLNASFSRTPALPGRIAFMSQSGALGEVILNHARTLELGLSMFASVGNKTNVSGNDLLLYWEEDPRTEIILLYLENFGDPRRFTEIARRLTRKKPVVAVKAGRSRSGAAAASSHTGSLAGSEIATAALFEQCGVLRVDTVRELFDVALALDSQKPPRGRRLAVVTNAGGPGILATDAAVARGFRLPPLARATRERLRRVLPQESSLRNPVDLLADATPERYREALRLVLRDPGIDAVVVIFVPPVMIDATGVARAITEACCERPEVPVVGCFMGPVGSLPEMEEAQRRRIPIYTFPEEAILALDALARYGEWLGRRPGPVLFRRARLASPTRAASLLEAGLARRKPHLLLSEALELLRASGIATAPFLAGSWGEAVPIPELESRVGYPMVLKADVPSEQHKTERRLLHLGIEDRSTLRKALDALRREAPRGSGWVAQREIRGDLELIVGMATDPLFGPLFVLGLGGTEVEVLRDVAFRLHPLTGRDVEEMMRSLRGYPLLRGYRGRTDVKASQLKDIMARLGRLVAENPRIQSLEINPLIAQQRSGRLLAVDARVLLA
jgi:acetyl coenzyme A synthetase (ADP forming)-like protein